MQTPFTDDGAIDYEAYDEQVERLCASEVNGLVACGSTGEFTLLTQEESISLLRRTASLVDGRMIIIGGATAADTSTTLKYLSVLAELGYCGALVAPPYFFPLGDEDVSDFYKTLDVARIGIPIVAYQIPQFTSDISASAFERLLALDGITGLKNSCGGMSRVMSQLLARNSIRPGFTLLSGLDDCLLPYLTVGVNGSFTAMAGIFPELVVSLYECLGTPAALGIQMKLARLVEISRIAPFPIGYKLLSEVAGKLRCGNSRQPASRERVASMRGRIAEAYVKCI